MNFFKLSTFFIAFDLFINSSMNENIYTDLVKFIIEFRKRYHVVNAIAAQHDLSIGNYSYLNFISIAC